MKTNKSCKFKSEATQKEHFNRLAELYEAHYDSPENGIYRDRFINKHLFKGINLKGAKVLEAMCGSGQTTGFLLANGAEVTGLDISPEFIERFKKRWPQAECVTGSILNTGFPDNYFDVVVIVGGLHHVHPAVGEAVDEVYRVLKPGGYFSFMEPHAGSIPDVIRKAWYFFDKYFAENEASVDLEMLKKENKERFEFIAEFYFGNVAFLFVWNSMILRIPLWLKKIYSPALIGIEALLNPLQGKRLSCLSVSRWRKKGLAAIEG